eukprot:14800688-Alexandrium_andersonii.AAC.1
MKEGESAVSSGTNSEERKTAVALRRCARSNPSCRPQTSARAALALAACSGSCAAPRATCRSRPGTRAALDSAALCPSRAFPWQ